MKKKKYFTPVIDVIDNKCFETISVILASGEWYGDDWEYNFDGEDDNFGP